MGKYYCYRHIRPDKNTPFYIGIGTKPNNFSTTLKEYSRAFSKDFTKRTLYWKNIFLLNKENIIVDIIFESDDYEEIKRKEKEFIQLYGRIDKKQGCLVNLTDGGEGQNGIIRSDKTREILRSTIKTIRKNFTMSGKKQPKSFYDKMCKPVLKYTKNGALVDEYNSIAEAVRQTDRAFIASILGVIKGKRKTAAGFVWKYKN